MISKSILNKLSKEEIQAIIVMGNFGYIFSGTG